MSKKFKNQIIHVLAILLVIYINIDKVFSANVIFNPSIITFDNQSVGPYSFPFDKMIVTGDSYAGYFCDFEDNRDFRLTGFAIAGRTIEENKKIMQEALANPNFNLSFICIGVNDHYQKVPPYLFESTLRSILEVGVANNKCVFINSYVYYPLADLCSNYPIYMYDNVIRKLSIEYPNVYYIDMCDCSNDIYISNDNIHYGKAYYDIMYDRMISALRTIAF